MRSHESYFLTNLGVLTAAVEARDARAIDLDASAEVAPDVGPVSLSGLILRLSHFDDLGVVPMGAMLSTSPLLAGRDVQLPAATLRLLFGMFGDHDPVDVLVPGYGQGGWDSAIMKWFPTPPSHKKLALARLLHAREVVQGITAASPPACAPRHIRVVLALPGTHPEAVSFRRNLEMLLVLVDDAVADRFVLSQCCGSSAGDAMSPETLVVESPYFHCRGVRPDPISGAAVMYDDDGCLLRVSDCMNHLFGTFERQEAFDALFTSYGAGCWDAELLAGRVQPPTHKQLALARMQRALGETCTRASTSILRVPVGQAG